MKRAILALLLLVAACGTTNPPGPPLASHTIHFWPYAAAPYLANPPKGMAGLTLTTAAVYTQADVQLAHSKGLKAISNIGGGLPTTPAQEAALVARAQQNGKWGFDFLFVDEPSIAPGAAFLVSVYNPIFAAFKQANPGGLVGICQDGAAFHNDLFDAGLKADFACLETYSGDTLVDVASIKAQHPAVEIMMLSYGKAQTCATWNSPLIDWWGFWDVDNSPALITGVDPSWPKDALALAAGAGC